MDKATSPKFIIRIALGVALIVPMLMVFWNGLIEHQYHTLLEAFYAFGTRVIVYSLGVTIFAIIPGLIVYSRREKSEKYKTLILSESAAVAFTVVIMAVLKIVSPNVNNSKIILTVMGAMFLSIAMMVLFSVKLGKER